MLPIYYKSLVQRKSIFLQSLFTNYVKTTMNRSRLTPYRTKVGYAILLSGILLLLLYDLNRSWWKLSDELDHFLQNTTYFLDNTLESRQVDTRVEIQEILENIELRKGMSIGVVDSTLELLARHPYVPASVIRFIQDSTSIAFIKGTEQVMVFETVSALDGLEKRVRMSRVNGKSYIVFVAESTGRYFSAWKSRVYIYILLYVLIAVGAFFIVKYQIRLQRSENKIRWLIDNISNIPIQGYYSDGTIFYWNKASEKLYGYTEQEAIGKTAYELIVPAEFLGDVKSQATDILSPQRGPSERTWVLKNKNDDRFTVQSHYIVIDDRNPVEIFTLNVNLEPMIQAQKQIEQLLESKETLLKEVHHRIKNNMSTISGLLWLQTESIKEPLAAEALLDAQSRVNNMMLLYNKLYQSNSFKVISSREYLNDLIDQIRQTQDPSARVIIEAQIENHELDSKLLLPLGMIVNELLSNVYKYAFPKGSGGRVEINLRFPDTHNMVLEVRDSGKGLPDSIIQTKKDDGFGFVLINMLTQQQGAVMEIQNSPGAHFTIHFPI